MRHVLIALVIFTAGLARADRPDYGGVKDVVQLAVDGQRIYALLKNGNVLADSGAGFETYDDGTGTKQIAADSGTLYALKNNGNVWRRPSRGAWQRIDDGTGTKQIFARAGGLFVLKNNGNIFSYDGARWFKIDEGTGTKQIAGDRQGNLYVPSRSPAIARAISTCSRTTATSGRTRPSGRRSTTAPARA
jgi:hypothetical protein